MADGFEKGLDGLDRGPQPSDTPEATVATPTSEQHPAVDALRAQFGAAIGTHTLMSRDEHVVYVDRESAFEILRFLRDDQQFDLCKDITAIDYGGNRPLELFYELWSIKRKQQLRVKVVLAVTDLEADSVVAIWKTADWLERECYDMFGIIFRNHPDFRRILMPENYAEGYPLRKDFPLRGRFSRAEQTRRALALDAEDHYTKQEMEVGGEPAAQGDRTKNAPTAEAAAAQDTGESDPAFGNVPVMEREPVAGGEASTGVNP
jgi:NADH-quinone oxidoreductase subunit C